MCELFGTQVSAYKSFRGTLCLLHRAFMLLLPSHYTPITADAQFIWWSMTSSSAIVLFGIWIQQRVNIKQNVVIQVHVRQYSWRWNSGDALRIDTCTLWLLNIGPSFTLQLYLTGLSHDHPVRLVWVHSNNCLRAMNERRGVIKGWTGPLSLDVFLFSFYTLFFLACATNDRSLLTHFQWVQIWEWARSAAVL